MIGIICLGLGVGLFFGSWNGYDRNPKHEDFFENLGSLGFWLFITGLILTIWG